MEIELLVVVIHQTPGGEDDDDINMAGLDAGFLDSVILDGMMDGSNLLLVLFFLKNGSNLANENQIDFIFLLLISMALFLSVLCKNGWQAKHSCLQQCRYALFLFSFCSPVCFFGARACVGSHFACTVFWSFLGVAWRVILIFTQ